VVCRFLSAQPCLSGRHVPDRLSAWLHPFRYLYGRLAGWATFAKSASGNIGATNVLRTGRKGLALLTLLSDAARASSQCCCAGNISGWSQRCFARLVRFLGHLYPVWLRFRGGKASRPISASSRHFIGPRGHSSARLARHRGFVTRYSSLSALIRRPLLPFLWPSWCRARFMSLCLPSPLFIAKHRQNIRNLISGHESKDRPDATGARHRNGPGKLYARREKLAWLRLIRTPHIGVVTSGNCCRISAPRAAIEALPEFAKFGSRVTARTIPTVAAAEAELKRPGPLG